MKALLNRELEGMSEILRRLDGVASFKLAYASARSIKTISQEMETLEKVHEQEEDYKTYLKELNELQKEHCKKDKDGNPEVQNINMPDGSTQQVLQFPDIKGFEKALQKLRKKHLEAVEKQETKEKNYQEILGQETTVSLHKIKLEDIKPLLDDKKITGAQFIAAAFLLDCEITPEIIPDDIAQKDVMILMEYFNI